MATNYMQRLRVNAPAALPARFGLLSAAALVVEDDPHWFGGIEFDRPSTAPARAFGGPTCEASETSKLAGQTWSTSAADPFTLVASDECSPIGRTPEEARARAEAALLQGEQRGMERTFWTGDTVDGDVIHPHLAEDTADPDGAWPAAEVLAAGAVSVKRGFSLLEGAMGECYGGRAVIHAPASVAAFLGDGMVARVGAGAAEHLETVAGTLVALGGGYPGTGPDGADPAADTAWLYATGAVVVRRGAAVPLGGGDGQWINRAVNTREVIVERTYSVGIDSGCLFAVRVILPAA